MSLLHRPLPRQPGTDECRHVVAEEGTGPERRYKLKILRPHQGYHQWVNADQLEAQLQILNQVKKH